MLRPAGMFWNGQKVTDHNRTPIQISVERIERFARMANGTARKYVVAKKKTFTTSWDMLPDSNTAIGGMDTVDQGMAASDIETFHNTVDGPFTLQLYTGRNTSKTYTVMFSDFSKEIQKRGVVDFWAVSVSLIEV